MSVGLFGGGGMKVTGSDRLEFAILPSCFVPWRFATCSPHFGPPFELYLKQKDIRNRFTPWRGIIARDKNGRAWKRKSCKRA